MVKRSKKKHYSKERWYHHHPNAAFRKHQKRMLKAGRATEPEAIDVDTVAKQSATE